jgi:adenine-specific DNA-methyltransferase
LDPHSTGADLSRLTDLIAQARRKDPQLGADLEREFKVVSSRLSFGLNFERHHPEAVVAKVADKLRVLDLTRDDVRKVIAAATSAGAIYASG